ncbi:TlpA family protein disulfide reductase [Epilithonimonas tenax]|uniref:TlpA family protein disulfide reductase n=1 Tax=Epilithonimonas tenax TaxID=191577 RepID=UPI000687FD79|nr:hypothetical protein [Epilithonimonas tenax]
MTTILKSKTPIFILMMTLFSFSLNAMQSRVENQDRLIPQNNVNDNEDIILIDESGNKIALSELKGKVVFVNFWATW